MKNKKYNQLIDNNLTKILENRNVKSNNCQQFKEFL